MYVLLFPFLFIFAYSTFLASFVIAHSSLLLIGHLTFPPYLQRSVKMTKAKAPASRKSAETLNTKLSLVVKSGKF